MTDTPLPLPQIVAAAVRQFPAIIPHLSPTVRQALKLGVSYPGIRAEYWLSVYDNVEGYLTGNKPVTTFRTAVQRAMVEAFQSAAELAYTEAGGELPWDEETSAWFVARQSAEMAFIAQLFENLRDNWQDMDPQTEATARADGYTSALDGVYNEASLYGSKNIVAYWRLGNTEKHCPDCAKLNGQGHRVSWYIQNDFIPRKSGCSLSCGGWNCDCRLEDKSGNEITL